MQKSIAITLCLAASAAHAEQPIVRRSLEGEVNRTGSLYRAELSVNDAPNDSNAGRTSFYRSPPPEPHVIKKRDIINVVVREESSSQSTGTTDLKKNADLDAKVDAFVKFQAARFSIVGGAEGANPPEVKLESSRDFKGDGSYVRNDTVTMRLGAEVIDVKPNGTMLISAKRHVQTDEEEVWVTLTGVCRVQDVDGANSVLSTDLHDLDFRKTTKGAVTDTARRGWLPRLLDFINPF